MGSNIYTILSFQARGLESEFLWDDSRMGKVVNGGMPALAFLEFWEGLRSGLEEEISYRGMV